MDEKHDQTVAMLNEGNHPPRTRIAENRSGLTRVIGKSIEIVDLIDLFE